MKKLHMVVGVLALVIFVLTGQYLRRAYPDMPAVEPGLRMLLRSRHLYIMLAGAVNSGLGLYLAERGARWRRVLQRLGSALILLSPVLLIVAFFIEPERGIAGSHLAPLGLFAMFGGTVIHLISSAGSRQHTKTDRNLTANR